MRSSNTSGRTYSTWRINASALFSYIRSGDYKFKRNWTSNKKQLLIPTQNPKIFIKTTAEPQECVGICTSYTLLVINIYIFTSKIFLPTHYIYSTYQKMSHWWPKKQIKMIQINAPGGMYWKGSCWHHPWWCSMPPYMNNLYSTYIPTYVIPTSSM